MAVIGRIDLNTAPVGELTQLPGIAKNLAYNIVNHRKRHGMFSSWEEVVKVKDFPEKRLGEIQQRARLGGLDAQTTAPRHPARAASRRDKAPRGYTKSLRTTRRTQKANHR